MTQVKKRSCLPTVLVELPPLRVSVAGQEYHYQASMRSDRTNRSVYPLRVSLADIVVCVMAPEGMSLHLSYRCDWLLDSIFKVQMIGQLLSRYILEQCASFRRALYAPFGGVLRPADPFIELLHRCNNDLKFSVDVIVLASTNEEIIRAEFVILRNFDKQFQRRRSVTTFDFLQMFSADVQGDAGLGK